MMCDTAVKWKRITLSTFGKASKAAWHRAMLDIQCVDKELKPACLFDLWSVCPDVMFSYLKSLHKEGLVSNQLNVLLVGMDVIVYKSLSKSWPKNPMFPNPYFVDITVTLAKPVLMPGTENIIETKTVFDNLCHETRSPDPKHPQEIKISDSLNVPTLFGLLLGYPCVYWYDTTKGEENNLAGFALRLFQVKGYFDSSQLSRERDSMYTDNNIQNDKLTSGSIVTKDDRNCAIIYSFTVPELLAVAVRDKVWAWYQAWESSVSWSHLFSKVAMSEQSLAPSAVCL
ncbi:UPF0739 protein C1orf74 homolog [Elysia marginata]|uniref:UPF0739 protein C1orf74 homolog n=1 Tax=Elysia marginata TaxID=1093978 RepID=A0AAV4EJF3_9GAST|nr:UPF0739 protein C1orf74 homolog [Elysia marginata]